MTIILFKLLISAVFSLIITGAVPDKYHKFHKYSDGTIVWLVIVFAICFGFSLIWVGWV